jgi:hypothetical protein
MLHAVTDPRSALPLADLLRLWEGLSRHDDPWLLRAALACRLAFELGATGPEILELEPGALAPGLAELCLGAGTPAERRLPTTAPLRAALRLFEPAAREATGTPAGSLVVNQKQALYRDVRRAFGVAGVPMPARPLVVLREHALLRKAAEGLTLAELAKWAGISAPAFLGGRRPHLAPFRGAAGAA